MNFKTLCELGSRLVDWPEGINGFAVLWAIGGVESSFGTRAVPKFEKAYSYGGKYQNLDLLRKHGDLAACSLGPWQIMYPNVYQITYGEVNPLHMYEPTTALLVTAIWMQKNIIGKGAKTIEEIADAWNSGSHRDSFIPTEYIAKVKSIYNDIINSPNDQN